jgi:hypothetical protein
MKSRDRRPSSHRSPRLEPLEGRCLLSGGIGRRPPVAGQFATGAAVARPFKLDVFGIVNQRDFSLSITGHATHLGKFTAVGQITANAVDPSDPRFLLRSGTLTFTAANGDELTVDFTDARVDRVTGVAHGVFVVRGGTGRFEDASGTLPFEVRQSSVTSPSFELIVDGRIAY